MDKEAFLIKLGARISTLRKSQKMKQAELAALCDIETPNLRRIEAGRTNPTALTCLKISQALNIPLKDIFDFELS
jgi:transcriptional regulator with XRE-family HTH domain